MLLKIKNILIGTLITLLCKLSIRIIAFSNINIFLCRAYKPLILFEGKFKLIFFAIEPVLMLIRYITY